MLSVTWQVVAHFEALTRGVRRARRAVMVDVFMYILVVLKGVSGLFFGWLMGCGEAYLVGSLVGAGWG